MKIILALFFALNIFAITPDELDKKGVLHYETISHGEVLYKFLITREQGMAKLQVFDEAGDILLTRKRGLALEGFKRLKIKSLLSQKTPYLITYWKKGAHGSAVEIFKLAKGQNEPIKIINSYLSMDYLDDLDSFSFTYDKGLKTGDLSPIKYRIIFSGDGQIKEQKL
ncbi:hypothetical protein [Bacteriovorax sp. DB6_IX]|uniref:hypothetical protein n=1 Tax=Bacteriovorax sp. DB6_IX TaxID=1353530 RepID=UPI00038A39EC|nr:hypothetical protein [Bacteriovorax sp. DB6_IX]EQC51632.1 hypothetical protein M901_2156 [Bacteriovorax sp. DB6_IX]